MIATNNIDGDISCLTGRFGAYRSSISQDPAFREAYLNEYCSFGLVGLLNVDDDNFVTRWMINRGWEIKIQHGKTIEDPSLGQFPKFLGQYSRWNRTTWRSSPRALVERTAWRRQPWCIYSVYLSSLVNFSLFYYATMVYALWFSFRETKSETIAILALAVWIFCTKIIKPLPHFLRYPKDIRYLPALVIFGYIHLLFHQTLCAAYLLEHILGNNRNRQASSKKLENDYVGLRH